MEGIREKYLDRDIEVKSKKDLIRFVKETLISYKNDIKPIKKNGNEDLIDFYISLFKRPYSKIMEDIESKNKDMLRMTILGHLLLEKTIEDSLKKIIELNSLLHIEGPMMGDLKLVTIILSNNKKDKFKIVKMLFQKEIVDIISKKLDEIRDIEEIKMLLKVIDNKIDNYNC